MEGLCVSLITALPEFANDFCDELKLFYHIEGFHVNSPSAEGEPLLHCYAEENGVAVTYFYFRGKMEQTRFSLPEETEGNVLSRRTCKRYCKQTLYRLLKELTGIQPPWGSLTGIRPTRLFRQTLAEGKDPVRAQAHMMELYDLTPEKAALVRSVVHEQDLLPAPSANDIDVYISIPFCRTRCAYCSFPGEAIGKGECVPAYLDKLFEEMEQGQRLMQSCGYQLRALYIGGGTPTSLSEPDFSRLIHKTMELFPGGREYTVEAGRPDTITPGKLQVLKDARVNRISINPQTMNDETLEAIGRRHTAEDTRNAFALARSMGFDNINMDVIVALPGENLEHFRHTMDEILRLDPDSLTVHALAIKRASRLNLEKYPLPEGDTAADMVRLSEKYAEKLGMAPYYLYRQKNMAGLQQNVGYARPGRACLYNVDIMEETLSILAFGAGAISKRVPDGSDLLIERAPNVSDVGHYIQRVDEMVLRKNKLFCQNREENP